MNSPEFSWLEEWERKSFSLGPLRIVEGIGEKTSFSHNSRSPYVLISSSNGKGRIYRKRATASQIKAMSLSLAEKTDELVLVGKSLGLDKDGIPVFRSVARALTPTAKAAIDPLSEESFTRWVVSMTRKLGILAANEARDLIRDMFDLLEFDWLEASGEKWLNVTGEIQAVFSSPSQSLITAQRVAISDILTSVLSRVTGSAIRMPTLRGNIASTFNLRNAEISRAMTRHHGFYVRDQYGRISPGLSRQVQRIIIEGLDKGLGRREISRILNTRVTDGLTMKGYWETVSANAIGRSRSYGLGASFRAAGITHFRIEAIIDEQTTETCMMLHESVIPVDGAMMNLDRILSDSNPESVKWNQAFIGLEGDDFRTRYPDGSYTRIATRESPREGDQPGVYSNRLSGSQLVGAGVGFPPYHHRCRTTAVPEV